MEKFTVGHRFTDEVYATKDEVKAIYNQDNVDSIWDDVLTYRQFFDFETDLIDNSGNHYKICLTKKLLAQSYNLQLKLMSLNISLSSLPEDLKNLFRFNQIKKSLNQVSQFESIEVSDNTIDKIIHNELENISPKLYPLKAYLSAYQYAISNNEVTSSSFDSINKILSGLDVNSNETKYRNTECHEVINPLIAPLCSKIAEQFASLDNFNKQEEIPVVLRALGIIYFFTYVRPYEFANEESSGLAAKKFLYNSLGYIGFSLPLESLPFTVSSSYFRKLKSCESSLDLTYFMDATIQFLRYSSDLLTKEVNELIQMNEERKLNRINSTDEDQEINPESSNIFALPDFPTAQTEVKIEAITKKLLEVYPQLKKKQAHFYASHCQVGLNYTIEQFKKEEKTVYETARTSMEDLANRGFYKKLQIGKKFVYTPIPLKETE